MNPKKWFEKGLDPKNNPFIAEMQETLRKMSPEERKTTLAILTAIEWVFRGIVLLILVSLFIIAGLEITGNTLVITPKGTCCIDCQHMPSSLITQKVISNQTKTKNHDQQEQDWIREINESG